MKNEQIHQIIREKNDQRERNVLRTAEQIIEQIVIEQQKIANATTAIASLRDDLRKLEVEQLDANAVLGTE